MRTHGWSGNSPSTDGEAVERILQAAGQLIDDGHSEPSILQIAKALGVTRQTVYRYFSSTDEVVRAAAEYATTQFLTDLAAELRGITDLADAVVEGIALTLEMLHRNRRFQLLFSDAVRGAAIVAVTSPRAIELGRSITDKFDVDWGDDWTERDRDELVEHMLRTLQSFILDPGHPPRTGDDLRRYLHRWAGIPDRSTPVRSPSPSRP